MQNEDVENLLKDDIAAASIELLADRSPRRHLGASEIGEECERMLVYKFRWINAEIFVPRMLRLFERGHLEELRLIRWLRWKGWTVDDVDPATGEQFKLASVNGHFGGGLDGFLSHRVDLGSYKFLLEFKTIATGPFGQLAKEGVKSFRPKHWAQMCTYGFAYELSKVAYLTVNKNDDDIAVKVIDLDHDHGKAMYDKASRVIGASRLPPRISENPAFFKCKFCTFSDNCHKEEQHAVNCRSCTNAIPVENKKWACKFHNAIIPDDVIKTGCGNWSAF